MEHRFDMSQIPPSWFFCFSQNCPLHETCLRYQTGLELTAERERGNAIYPTAYRNNSCSYYRPAQKVKLVTGFVNSKNPAMHQAFIALRHQIGEVTGGGGSYYMYRNGKLWLTPKQQEQIREIFVKAGYREPTYDHYEMDYDFT